MQKLARFKWPILLLVIGIALDMLLSLCSFVSVITALVVQWRLLGRVTERRAE
jgi:hypothetical protein